MSFIDNSGLDADSAKLVAMLDAPPEKEKEAEGELPIVPAVARTQNRNTIEPKTQSDAPEEVSVEVEEAEETEPPASWTAEAKELWAKLPPDVREVISSRETERERAINLKLQETSALRQQYETEQAQTLQYRQAYEQRLNVLAKQLEANIPAEFRNIRSTGDLQQLSERDPAAAQRFMIWRESAVQVLNELSALDQQKAAQASANQRTLVEREAKVLAEKWPELADPTRGSAIRDEIVELLHGFGFNNEEIGGISDHRILLFAKQFMEGQKALKALEKAKAKVVVKPLPKVVAPSKGEATGPGNGVNKGALSKIARSGNMDATAAAMAKLFG